jgi:UPF0042 nucleotide-binding protein
MRLIVVSGLSGSGKSVALHMLEDLDWFCVDNIPAALLKAFVSHTLRSADARYERVAVGLDARNTPEEIATVPALLAELRSAGLSCELVFVTASDDALLRRYADTRRRHPLSRSGESLREAIEIERRLLDPVVQAADLLIDTSSTGVHELRELVRVRVERRSEARLALLFQSFGFKYGIPGDSDFVFDARSLPNPYWERTLRPLTGRDAEVARFLAADAAVARMQQDITQFVEARIGEFIASNRRYLTVSVGCTGGQHRSVYLVEQLAAAFVQRHHDVQVRHADLPDAPRSLDSFARVVTA